MEWLILHINALQQQLSISAFSIWLPIIVGCLLLQPYINITCCLSTIRFRYFTQQMYTVLERTWLREYDSNIRPLSYEHSELPLLYPAIQIGNQKNLLRHDNRRLHSSFLLVELLRLELRNQESKSCVIPFHHNSVQCREQPKLYMSTEKLFKTILIGAVVFMYMQFLGGTYILQI